MKIKSIVATIVSLLIFSLVACNENSGELSETGIDTKANNDLNILFEKYWEKQAKFFPINATVNGDNRYNDQWPNDQTQAFRDTLNAYYASYLNQVKEFDREKLNALNQISYDIFIYEMNRQLDGLKLNTWMMPFDQFWALPLLFGQMGSGSSFQPFKTVTDYDNWLGRIHGFTLWADAAIANFRKGMAAGVVLPKTLVVKMIPQMESMVVADPAKSLFYTPIKKIPKSFSDADKQRLDEAYRRAILVEIVPTFKKLGAFLKNEYLPKARTTSGISAIPGGKDIYNYYVRYWTTTHKAPEEIYQTGVSEVARITHLMDSVKTAVGFKGDLKEFFHFMETDKQFMPFTTSRQVLDAFEAIHQKMKPQLKKLFKRIPKTPFEIRQTEAFRAASASAEYNAGNPDGSRPGIFYVPILDAATFNVTSGMECLFLHEAIPGHHYQISLQREDTLLPKFRRFSWYGAYGEGYALYCETLGKELGLYTDPYQYMAALGDEMHRAIRLVVDVAIHTKGWTREQAIQYMMSKEPISEQSATAEIERYMALPGQALSYKTGQLKIVELRNTYQQELGDKFNIADFHDELLNGGCLPLEILESKMDAWAAKKKGGNP